MNKKIVEDIKKPIRMFGVGDEYDITEYAVCWNCVKAFDTYTDDTNKDRWRDERTPPNYVYRVLIKRCDNCNSWNIIRAD